MESYSYSLGDETVVEPNVAIQSVTRGSDSGSSVLFSVQKGKLLAPCPCNSKEQPIDNHKQFLVHQKSTLPFLTGSSGSLVSGGTSINKTADGLNPDGQTELQILLNTGESMSQTFISLFCKHTQI